MLLLSFSGCGSISDFPLILPRDEEGGVSAQTVNSASHRSWRLQKLVAHRAPLNPAGSS